MYCRENHQPSFLPCGHVLVRNVTYFTKILKPPNAAVFVYSRYLLWYCLLTVDILLLPEANKSITADKLNTMGYHYG